MRLSNAATQGPPGEPDINDEGVPFDERCRGDSKKVLWHFELGGNIALPIQLPGLKFQAMQFPFSADRVDAISINHGARPGAVVVSITICELGRVDELPVAGSSLGVQTFHDLLIPDPVQINEPFACNGGRTVAGSLAHFPKERRTAGWPALQ